MNDGAPLGRRWAGGSCASRYAHCQERHPVVNVRFYIDQESGESHIAGHGVTEEDVRDVLVRPLEDRPGREGARVALGQTPQVVSTNGFSARDNRPASARLM